jgi:hypothetical protein
VLALAAVALASFAALAVWANTTPPHITHREAMRVAAAIEQAKTIAELEGLLDVAPLFPDPAWSITSLIASAKARGSYTFLQVKVDDRERRSLLFRMLHHVYPLEYHELRLERRGGAVKVTDVWSCVHDGWYSDLRRELEPESRREEADTFMQRILDHQDADVLDRAFSGLPPEIRRARSVGMLYLMDAAVRRPEALPAMTTAFLAEWPDHIGPGMLRLWHQDAPRGERLAAIDELAERVPDGKFLDQLRGQIARGVAPSLK